MNIVGLISGADGSALAAGGSAVASSVGFLSDGVGLSTTGVGVGDDGAGVEDDSPSGSSEICGMSLAEGNDVAITNPNVAQIYYEYSTVLSTDSIFILRGLIDPGRGGVRSRKRVPTA